MRNNRGVTLIMLVITVIVLIMLTTFAVYYSQDIAPEARLATAYSSLKEVKTACMEAKSAIELRPDLYDEYDFFGKNIFLDGSDVEDLAKRCGLTSSDEFSKEHTYKISPELDDENKRRIEKLEISSVDRIYICDIENNNYYLVNGVKRKTGSMYYEYKDIQYMYEMLTETKD